MNTIKKIREQKTISQVELSKKVGVSQGAISQWETGQSLPRAELLPKIAEILGCTVDELLGRDERGG